MVRDELEAIAREIAGAVAREPALVFTVGGLGPTSDDRTLEGVALGLGVPLELHPEAERMVREKYAEFHARGYVPFAEMNDARRKMAMLPAGARPIVNPIGGAPAVLAAGRPHGDRLAARRARGARGHRRAVARRALRAHLRLRRTTRSAPWSWRSRTSRRSPTILRAGRARAPRGLREVARQGPGQRPRRSASRSRPAADGRAPSTGSSRRRRSSCSRRSPPPGTTISPRVARAPARRRAAASSPVGGRRARRRGHDLLDEQLLGQGALEATRLVDDDLGHRHDGVALGEVRELGRHHHVGRHALARQGELVCPCAPRPGSRGRSA